MARKKIALIGAGNIGGELAMLAARKELGDITLLDIPNKEGIAQGKALDISQACALSGYDSHIKGTSNYSDISGADIVIVTAGLPRKPGMSRDDLLAINLKIINSVGQNIKTYAPNALVIVISNPLDAMVYEMKRVTGFKKSHVIGMAGALDAARFQHFIAEAANVSVKDINTLVLGGHGDTMVPCIRYCTINGIPVSQLLKKPLIDSIIERTRFGGGEVVDLMGTSAYYAPAAGAISMAESFLYNQKKVISCAAYLEGEYGYKDIYMGVPCIIGEQGLEKVVEVELSIHEKSLLDNSAASVQSLIERSHEIQNTEPA